MKYLCLNNYWPINKEYNLDKLLYLMTDRPDEIYMRDYYWLNNNNKKQFHRDYDLPSWIFHVVDKYINLSWHKNSNLHREKSKPAFIDEYNDYKKYYINGKFIKEKHFK